MFKKFRKGRGLLFALMLCCAIVSSALGEASGQSAISAPDLQLAAAFETGGLTLREIPLFSDPGGYTLRIPKAYFESALKDSLNGKEVTYSQDGAWVMAELSKEDLALMPLPDACSISPDGGRILYMDRERAYVVQGRVITVIAPDFTRGVPDSHGSFAKFAAMPPGQWTGSEGVAWSPDGRYAVLTNFRFVLMMMKFIYGLNIIDTQTGQLYCADTYPDKPFEGGASVIQACFDTSGRYIYYMLYGPMGQDSPNTLMRYDMETGEKEQLYTGTVRSAYPRLQWAPGGQLVNLMDALKADEALGLNIFGEKGGAWTASSLAFSQPLAIARPTYLETGPAGLGVLLQSVVTASLQLPARFDMNAGFAGYDELLLIESLDAPSAAALPLSAASYGDGGELAEKIPKGKVLPCANITLSPDGHYALLLVLSDSQTCGILMMDLKTLALRQVKLPAGAAPVHPYRTPSGFGWYDGNKVVIPATDGLRLYEFAY